MTSYISVALPRNDASVANCCLECRLLLKQFVLLLKQFRHAYSALSLPKALVVSVAQFTPLTNHVLRNPSWLLSWVMNYKTSRLISVFLTSNSDAVSAQPHATVLSERLF